MKIAKVVGTVTLSRAHDTLQGIPLRLVEVVAEIGANGELKFESEQVVSCDCYGAGIGDLIAMAEGPEAAQPFRPDIKPVDANSAAILDSLEF